LNTANHQLTQSLESCCYADMKRKSHTVAALLAAVPSWWRAPACV
jgi:hypothetical protein